MPPKTITPQLTHFLCLPLVTPTSCSQLQASLSIFRDRITRIRTPQNPDGIPEAAVRSFRTLHLTLGVMSLSTPEKVAQALGLLRELDLKEFLPPPRSIASSSSEGEVEGVELGGRTVTAAQAGPAATVEEQAAAPSSSAARPTTITLTEERKVESVYADTKPAKLATYGEVKRSTTMTSAGSGPSSSPNLSITLKGLRSMQPNNPSKTTVLYAPPTPNNNLQIFCLKLRDAFHSANLLIPETRPLLLHATILNTTYVPRVGRDGRGRGGGGARGHGKSRARLTIDATEILEDWEGFEWMRDVRVEKVAVCKMGAKKLDDGTEEYVVEGSVDIPR